MAWIVKCRGGARAGRGWAALAMELGPSLRHVFPWRGPQTT